MCCGSKRSAWRATAVPSRAPSPAPSPAPWAAPPAPNGTQAARAQGMATPSFAVTLEYLRAAPIRVWGPATGHPYDFSGSQPTQAMDARDAAALSRTSLFRRAAT